MIRGVVKSGAVLAYREVQRTMLALAAVDLEINRGRDAGTPPGSGPWADADHPVHAHLETGTTLERHLADHLHGLARARRSPDLPSLDRQVDLWKRASDPYTSRRNDGRSRAG